MSEKYLGHSRDPNIIRQKIDEIKEKFPNIVNREDDKGLDEEGHVAWQTYLALKGWLLHLLDSDE